MSLVIAIPYNEKSYAYLIDFINDIIPKFDKILIPLPKELKTIFVQYCLDSINIDDIKTILQSLIPHYTTWFRINIYLINLMKYLAKNFPNIEVEFYESIEVERRSYNNTIDLLGLLLRYSISGRIDYQRLQNILKNSLVFIKKFINNLIQLIEIEYRKKNLLVILNSFLRYFYFKNLFTHAVDYLIIYPLIPTPIELLSILYDRNILNQEICSKCFYFLKEYIQNYVVTSSQVYESYLKLLNDEEYIKFIRKHLGYGVVVHSKTLVPFT